MLAALLEVALKLESRSLVCTPNNAALQETCARPLKPVGVTQCTPSSAELPRLAVVPAGCLAGAAAVPKAGSSSDGENTSSGKRFVTVL